MVTSDTKLMDQQLSSDKDADTKSDKNIIEIKTLLTSYFELKDIFSRSHQILRLRRRRKFNLWNGYNNAD